MTPKPTIPSGIRIEGKYFFSWNTRSLPVLSERLRAQLRRASIKYVTACAEAYGEDWVQDKPDFPIVGFSHMYSNFDLVLPVEDLTDLETTGNLAKEVILLVDALQTRTGFIYLTFVAGDANRALQFDLKSALQAVKDGLEGSVLLKELENHE